jgi:hypothetical protein
MDKLVDVVENTQEGVYWLSTASIWKRISLAFYVLYRLYMKGAKFIEPEFVLWLWFMLVGLIQLYMAVAFTDSVTSLDFITNNVGLQVLISAAFVIYGGVIAYWKRDWMIALGTVIAIIYSLFLLKGILSGGIDLRGLLPLVYITLMVMALIGFTSTRESNREQRKRIEKLEKTVADLSAGLAAKVGEKDGGTTAKPI